MEGCSDQRPSGRPTHIVGILTGPLGSEVPETLEANTQVLQAGDNAPQRGSLAEEVKAVQSAEGFFTSYRNEVLATLLKPSQANGSDPTSAPSG